MRNIWSFHHYATLPNLNGHLRPFYFGRMLKKFDIKMTIFAASYLHFSNKNLIDDKRQYIYNNDFEIPYIFIKTPSSVGKLSRVFNMVSFYLGLTRLSKKIAKEIGKPDLIYASSPHPLTLIAGLKVAKRFKIPCICEVRDLWPEAIFMGSNIKNNGILGRILTAGEHWIYKKADSLIFTKEGDTDYIKEKQWDKDHGGDIDLKKCQYINNGVNIEDFNNSIEKNILDDSDLDDKKFNVIYTGAIRSVNNVGNILNAASYLSDYKDIQFLIYGDGNEIEALKKRIRDENLTNIKMKGFVEKKYIPYILNKSSVNILNYSSTKYNWSRGNSSNKLFEYMASGKPIISTIKMGHCIINRYKCGFSLDEDTPFELAKIILHIKEMSIEDYNYLCNNARTAASEFDFNILTKKLFNVIKKVCQNE